MSQNYDLEVWKHNRLIDSRAKLSTQALRVFALAVAKLRPGDLSSRIVTFAVKEFAELIGSSAQTLHADLRKVARELRKADVEIPRYDRGGKDDGWLQANLAAAAELRKGTGVFYIEFAQLLAPYLFDLRERFTRYELQHVMKLSSKHAFKLYEILKSWENWRDEKGAPKSWRMTLADLRPLLGLGADEYPRYANFRQRILEPSREQINAHTDLRFDYREVKEGRKVVALELRLRAADELPMDVPVSTPEQQEKIRAWFAEARAGNIRET